MYQDWDLGEGLLTLSSNYQHKMCVCVCMCVLCVCVYF